MPGERVFDVLLDGTPVIDALDVFRESGGRRVTFIRELTGVRYSGRELDGRPALELTLRARKGAPLICGVEVAGAPPRNE